MKQIKSINENLFFNLLRNIYILCGIIFSIKFFKEDEYFRIFLFFITLIIFLVITEVFKRKKGLTFSYLYYYILIAINVNLASYFFNSTQIQQSFNNKIIFKDFYYVYLMIYFLISGIILFYILYLPNEKIRTIKIQNKISLNKIIVLSFLNLPIVYLKNEIGLIILSINIIYFCHFYSTTRNRIKVYILALILLLSIIPFLTYRYLLIQPLGSCFLYIIYTKKYRKKYNLFIFILLFFLVIIMIINYGIISEIIKLKLYYNMKNISFIEILLDKERYFYFIKKQIYRMFGIWIHLNANMIEYIKENNFFYGLSYLKNFASILGIEYINIPEISAKFIGATYAQSGLIMEGFFNFSYIGATISGLLPFFYLETLNKYFIKKMKIEYIILMIVPLIKIFFDGGSLQMMIYSGIICMVYNLILRIITSRTR